MPKVNHRRGFRGDDKYRRHVTRIERVTPDGEPYSFDMGLTNGYAPPTSKPWKMIDKSLHAWGRHSTLAGRIVGSHSIPNDFTNGNRGMAKCVRGAKKFVRTRIRFHENAETERLAREFDAGNPDS